MKSFPTPNNYANQRKSATNQYIKYNCGNNLHITSDHEQRNFFTG